MILRMKKSFGINADRASRRSRAARRNLSGQALTEAVIMLSLLSLTWMVTAYMLTLAENRVRCAAIGRHAAWLRAHNPAIPVGDSNLSPYFIRHSTVTSTDISGNLTRLVQVDESQSPIINPAVLGILAVLGLDTIPIQHVELQLNINNADDKWLYQIDNTDTEFPFMRGVFTGMGTVGIATSEWIIMSNFVEDLGAAVTTILSL